MTEAKRVDPYAHLMDLGRGALHQAIAAQRSALEYSRQFVEGDAAARPLRSQHEEWARKALETLAPFYALEQLVHDQLLKAQASIFELADDTLRNLTLHGVERRGHRST
ncbi:hypothetical protein HRD49_07825 [Corallococcus exiguus]|uniref:Uncharacterized protein n=1 Tax=Corallococcus exiguus TaxID=83462 RepID=A0A7Y1S0Y0_9BACT|nr:MULTISPECIES: hypothetical protein [Corallococcus]RKI36663.1 hypothetical protein D7Y27_27710 [Corallococcus sp. AB004]NBC44407.1 hypothetical protein [Corallococcus exiguus]NNC16105.1 hypothetical protein [Corallococcus exiguus]NPC70593.1 hypothetical protein [Corallococcus exiguus]NPD25963.1 hypothetical protein [Corallococcus exiguus]